MIRSSRGVFIPPTQTTRQSSQCDQGYWGPQFPHPGPFEPVFTQMFGSNDVTCPLHPLISLLGLWLEDILDARAATVTICWWRLTFWSNWERGKNVRPAVECLNVLWLWMFICWSLTTSALAPHDSSPAYTDSLCWLWTLLCFCWSMILWLDFDIAPQFHELVLQRKFDTQETPKFWSLYDF